MTWSRGLLQFLHVGQGFPQMGYIGLAQQCLRGQVIKWEWEGRRVKQSWGSTHSCSRHQLHAIQNHIIGALSTHHWRVIMCTYQLCFHQDTSGLNIFCRGSISISSTTPCFHSEVLRKMLDRSWWRTAMPVNAPSLFPKTESWIMPAAAGTGTYVCTLAAVNIRIIISPVISCFFRKPFLLMSGIDHLRIFRVLVVHYYVLLLYCIIYNKYIYITCKSEYIFQMSSWRWHQHLNKAKDIIGRNTGFFFLIFQYTASLACQIFEWHTCTPWSEEASRVNRVNHHCHRWQILENVLKFMLS